MAKDGRGYISLKDIPKKFNKIMVEKGYKNWQMMEGQSNLEKMKKKQLLDVEEYPKGVIGDNLREDGKMNLSVFFKFNEWTSACGTMSLMIKTTNNGKVNVHWKAWGQSPKNKRQTDYILPTHIASLDYVCSMLERTYYTGFKDNNGSHTHGVRHNMRKSHDTARCQACKAGVCSFNK